MSRTLKCVVLLSAFMLTVSGVAPTARADHDDHKGRRHHQKRERRHSEHDGKGNLTVNNPTYKENCGACHLAYQPGLLPSGSWAKLLAGLADHFGEAIELDPEAKTIIAEFLKANAADYSSAKLSAKIMRSIGDQTPLRITEIPYIQEKHHEINQNVLKRESVGSLSNCSACHTTAESGVYNDDNVKIPK